MSANYEAKGGGDNPFVLEKIDPIFAELEEEDIQKDPQGDDSIISFLTNSQISNDDFLDLTPTRENPKPGDEIFETP